ncbi:MAG: hypothetical protein ACEPOV_03330, partial [Hyphomicrobiales bacterium]
ERKAKNWLQFHYLAFLILFLQKFFNNINKAYSFKGKNSFKISKHDNYFNLCPISINKNIALYIRYWIKKDNNHTRMIFSNDNCRHNQNLIINNKNGWEQNEVIIEKKLDNNDYIISLWTPNDRDIYIDQFEIHMRKEIIKDKN